MTKGSRLLAIGSASVSAIILVLTFSSDSPFLLAPFREAQTAISARYLSLSPSEIWGYTTPVLGQPARIPFELGLFQWFTAAADKLFGNIALSGRLLSLLFWGLSLWQVARLLRDWFPERPPILVPGTLSLIVLAPVHQLAAQSHMIETFALFLALVYLTSVGTVEMPRWTSHRRLAGGAIAGTLCAAVKVTTWVPFAAWIGLQVVWTAMASRKSSRRISPVKAGVGLVVLLGVPLVVGAVWSWYASSIRNRNPLAPLGESTVSWNFGSIGMRLDPATWISVFGRHGVLLLGAAAVVVPFVFWAGRGQSFERPKGYAPFLFLSFAGYLVHVLVFLPLHLRHEYYIVGSGVLALAGLSVLLWGALTRVARRGRAPAPWMTALALSIAASSLGYVLLKRSYRDFEVESAVSALGSVPPGPIAMVGFDWSPYVPFMSARRALMVSNPVLPRERLERVISLNRSTEFAAVGYVNSASQPLAEELADSLLGPMTSESHFGLSGVLISRGQLPLDASSLDEARDYAELVHALAPDATDQSNGLVYFDLWVDGQGPTVIARRGSDAFILTPLNLSLVRLRGLFTSRPP